MFWTELLFLIAVATLFTLVFVVGLRRPGPWAAWWTFFLVIFLAAWAGSLWLAPVGPIFFGIYWLPIMLVSLVFAVLLAAVTPITGNEPNSKVETITEVKQKEEEAKAAESTVDAFFWVLIVIFAAIIIFGYFTPV